MGNLRKENKLNKENSNFSSNTAKPSSNIDALDKYRNNGTPARACNM